MSEHGRYKKSVKEKWQKKAPERRAATAEIEEELEMEERDEIDVVTGERLW